MEQQPNEILPQCKALCLQIRKIREAKNWTQEYMAHELNISQKAYSKIEAGITQLSVERLVQIATILQVDFSELLKGNKSESATEPEPHFYEKRMKQLEEAVAYLKKMLGM